MSFISYSNLCVQMDIHDPLRKHSRSYPICAAIHMRSFSCKILYLGRRAELCTSLVRVHEHPANDTCRGVLCVRESVSSSECQTCEVAHRATRYLHTPPCQTYKNHANNLWDFPPRSSLWRLFLLLCLEECSSSTVIQCLRSDTEFLTSAIG